jgi:hypothetical protein
VKTKVFWESSETDAIDGGTCPLSFSPQEVTWASYAMIFCKQPQSTMKAYDAHVTSWGLKDSGQVPPSKEVNEHWSNPNVLEKFWNKAFSLLCSTLSFLQDISEQHL